MRSFVCGQCHVEYYCGPKTTLFYPWNNGLKVEQIESYYDSYKFPDGHDFYDWTHGETGADVLKAQHPEFETVEPGHPRAQRRRLRRLPHAVQARRRDEGIGPLGAQPAAQRRARLPGVPPLLRRRRSRRASRRSRTARNALLNRSAAALTDLLDAVGGREEGAAPPTRSSHAVLALQRKAQWRLDFVAAENSMGFHAPQETARVLAEAIDYARQGQLAAKTLRVSGSSR